MLEGVTPRAVRPALSSARPRRARMQRSGVERESTLSRHFFLGGTRCSSTSSTATYMHFSPKAPPPSARSWRGSSLGRSRRLPRAVARLAAELAALVDALDEDGPRRYREL